MKMLFFSYLIMIVQNCLEQDHIFFVLNTLVQHEIYLFLSPKLHLLRLLIPSVCDHQSFPIILQFLMEYQAHLHQSVCPLQYLHNLI